MPENLWVLNVKEIHLLNIKCNAYNLHLTSEIK